MSRVVLALGRGRGEPGGLGVFLEFAPDLVQVLKDIIVVIE